MSVHSWALSDAVRNYLVDNSVREPDAMRRLREQTAGLSNAAMQISPEQGQLMSLLIEMIGARRAVEVGTFTGYSALAVARALPADGRLVACELERQYIDIATPYWKEAGVADRIEVRIGPAADSLQALLDEGEAGQFDFAFIDADKQNYSVYYDACLALIRPGGVVAIDNVLWGGSVADPDNQKPSTEAIRAINRRIHEDDRVSVSMVPIGDGLYLARKRQPA